VRKLLWFLKTSLITLSLAIFLSSCSKGDSTATPSPPTEIANGTPTGSNEHPSVGLVAGPNFICSGTLIAPNIVLTATHCTENDSHQLVSLKFTLAPQLSSSVSWTSVSSILRYSSQDIAILKLANPISGAQVSELSLTPANQSFLNRSVEIVGYGNSTTSSTPVKQDSGSGTKRKGTSLLFRLDDNQATLVSKPSSYGQTVCPGDSGGPLYLIHQGRKQLFGVASSVLWNGYCATVKESYHKQVAYSQTQTWLLNSLAQWYSKVAIYRTVNSSGQFIFSKTGNGTPVFKLVNVPANFSNATCTTPLLQCKTTNGTYFLNTQSCGTTGQFDTLLGYACNGAKTARSSVNSFDLWRVDNVQQGASLSSSLQETRQLSQQNSSWKMVGFLGVHVLSPY